MESFLEQSLNQLLESGKDLSEASFVLPSQRACVFLKEIWIKKSNKAGFLPRMIPIEKFIEELSGMQQLDRLPLLFEFYETYTTTVKKPAPFDEFSNWAITAIQDFNEIDRHLVDAQALFEYLSDIKRIESWNIGNDDYLVKAHFQFMHELGGLYESLKAKLLSQGRGYQGLLYREAESNIDSYCEYQAKQSVVLLGFNALNKAEENIFQTLLKTDVAQVFWDGDAFYMENNHIAGAFLRKYRDKWPFYKNNPFPKFPNRFQTEEKKLIKIAAPKNVAQVKYLGEVLEQDKNVGKRAIVLADENLLGLSLNALPKKIDKLNITMGYPLKNIPIATLFESLFYLYRNAKRLGLARDQFYYRDVLAVLSHPCLAVGKLDEIRQLLNKENQLFLNQEDLAPFLPDELLRFFENSAFDTSKFLQNCLDLIDALKIHSKGIDREYLFRFHKLFNQLNSLNKGYNYLKGIELIHDFFKQLLSEENLSFQGEPLEGLQLMGMLETRSLDFENLMILGVNEGILPSGKSDNSFIPFDVKRDFELPTYLEKDGIYAYHFFRLIQRSKQVMMTFNSETDGLGAGEQSRFITMLELEKLISETRIISPKVTKKDTKTVNIAKTDSVLIRLEQFAEKGVSPSSLNTYINNPPQFYFEKLLKIYQADQMEENVALNTLGTIIHDSLEDLYTPWIGKLLTIDGLDEMQKKSSRILENNFKKYFRKGDFYKGKNSLTYEVALTYVNSFISFEKKDIESGSSIEILSLEEELSTLISIPGIHYNLKLKGMADRIDKRNGMIRIIDYKTGKVKLSDLKCVDFEKIKTDSKMKYVLQVFFYTLLYKENYPETPLEQMQGGIISFKNFKDGFMTYNFASRGKDSLMTEERYEQFKGVLIELLVEIFRSKKPFEENPEKKYSWI